MRVKSVDKVNFDTMDSNNRVTMSQQIKTCIVVVSRVVIFALCVTGFAWLCWGQVMKFLSEITTVTVSWNRSKALRFPVITFCAEDAYNPGFSQHPYKIFEGKQVTLFLFYF